MYILNNESMYLGEVTKVNQGNNKKIHEDTSLRVLTKIILTHVRVDWDYRQRYQQGSKHL